ncbi:uncharacterized protein l(3)05822 [Panulirus ornatus]|uniref:uncharacterized protein l(3)05822 n=1 Tax=Panulirus ornatus TaxID=150431 RepID=UPI003A87A323
MIMCYVSERKWVVTMDDLLTGDIRPVRRAPPPPRSRTTGQQPRNGDLLVIHSGEEERQPLSRASKHPPQRTSQNGLPRSASLPLTNGAAKKKAPPPRPPPPKISLLQKFHHQLEPNSTSRSGSVTGGMFGRLRGPPPARPRPSPAHNSASAPNTPVNEASLIDFSSPPGSPTTRSGSDGLSVNSFGSESSSGNQSSGFDDSYDPFGSIQEPSTFAPPRKVGGSSFFSGTSPAAVTQTVLETYDNQDPFEMLARRVDMNHPQTQKPPVMQTQSTEQTCVLSNLVSQPSTQNGCHKPEQKNNFRPTIIRPKAPVSSSQVESAGDSGVSMNTQFSGLGSIDWSAASKCSSTVKSSSGWDAGTTHIIDQTIPEEPPPLPPRPEAEEEDQDRPYGIAEFDFAAFHSDDLDFKVGEAIQLLYRVNDDWLFGRCGLKEGIFPQSFIKIIVPLAGEKLPAVSTSHTDLTSGLGAANTSLQSKVSDSSSGSSHVVKVIYTFQAEAPEDLTIYENSMVHITGRLNDQWLYGECNGKCGQFPANFVDRVPPNLPQI